MMRPCLRDKEPLNNVELKGAKSTMKRKLPDGRFLDAEEEEEEVTAGV